MKKLLGISLVAVLAVSPMMANAAGEANAIALKGNPAGTITSTNDIATTSYVKGAYNDLAGHINTNVAAINTLNGDDTTSGSVAKAVKDAVDGINTTTSSLDSRLDTAEGEIDALQGTVGNATSGLVKGLADEVNDRQTADTEINNKIGTATYTGGTLSGAIATLQGDASTTGSVAKAVAEAIATEVTNRDAAIGVETTRAQGEETALGGRITAIEGTYATKDGVEGTINGLTYTTTLDSGSVVEGKVTVPQSAAVTVVRSWSDETDTGNATVNLTTGQVDLTGGTIKSASFNTDATAAVYPASQS